MISAEDITIEVTDSSDTENQGDGINVTSYVGGRLTDGNYKPIISLQASGSISITAAGDGISVAGYAYHSGQSTDYYNVAADVNLEASGNISITASGNGVDHRGAGTVYLLSSSGNNIISSTGSGDGLRLADSDANDRLHNEALKKGASGTIVAHAQKNLIYAADQGLNNQSSADTGTIELEAQTNYIYGGTEAITLGGAGKITVTAGVLSKDEVSGDLSNRALGSGTGIHADSGSTGTITLDAQENNYVAGSGAGILIEAGSTATITLSATGDNVIGAATEADTAYQEDEDSDEITTTISVAKTAVNAQGGFVNIKSVEGYNKITGLQYGVSASSGAEVNISGATQIMAADSSDTGITALYAAGADGETESGCSITLSYSSENYIFGDIEAENSASITAAALDDSDGATLRVLGNISSVAQAAVSLTFGNGGSLLGWVDSNIISSSTDKEGCSECEDTEAGIINLNFGDGSYWYMTDASSVNALTTVAGSVIQLNNDVNDGASYLMATSASGGGTIYMTLDGDRPQSSMLYFGEAEGEYNIVLSKMITAADVVGNGTYGNLLRFATVGSGSDVTFYVAPYKDVGLFDISYEVKETEYSAEDETNGDYNNGEGKPGQENVNSFLTTSEDGVSPLSATNYSLTVENSLSDAGKNIVDMARANYTMAVYLDTLNKRQGESRINLTGDDGVWLRVRHDNIGRDSAYRVRNTMFEIGYDHALFTDGGKWQIGAALDYMHGSVDYNRTGGDGDLDRYGVWAYATYFGDNGFYSDFVFKYGHMENDFDFTTKTTGEDVCGSYENDVWSISAEAGYKFQSADGWFAEPQVQLQYSYVTSADYTTSQHTKVSLDSIDSLIGRLGVRLGRDMIVSDTPACFYIRGDVLKEFLGDQDIHASDETGSMSVTYDNDDVWFDAGLGVSISPEENMHLFIEAEQIFGADYNGSYIFSLGGRYIF